MRQAGKHGLKGAIIRPGYATGDPKAGTTNADDFLIHMLKGCVQLSSRPNITNTTNMVPVTHVARVVVASMFDAPVEPLGVVQVTSHPRLTFNGFVGSFENYGYTIPQVSYDEWHKNMEQYVASSAGEQIEDHAL